MNRTICKKGSRRLGVFIFILFGIFSVYSCGGGGGGESEPVGTPPEPPTPVVTNVSIGQQVSDSVSASGTKFYSFVSDLNSTVYTISITELESDLSWTLYSNSDFSTGFIVFCDNFSVQSVEETCQITNLTPQTNYYFKIDEHDGINGSFKILVTAQ